MAENIDAERAAFEAAMPEHHPRDRNMPDGSYNSPYLHIAWEVWQLARRTPSASTGEDGLLELPVATVSTEHVGLGIPVGVATWREKSPPAGTKLYTERQVRDAIAADRQSRISADQWAALEAARMHLDAARIARESQQSRLRDKSPQAAQGVPEAWKYRALAGNGEWRVTLNEDCARSVNGDVDVVPLYAAPPLPSEQRAEKGDNSCGS